MTTKQYTIAEVLHYAADHCLAAESRFEERRGKKKFSCCAVDEAIVKMTGYAYSGESALLRRRVMDGLKAMGCDTGSSALFKKYGDKLYKYNHEVQGMRYMWLKWAALMAEEQGV